jgi:preprotein translocase subunit SecD
MTIRNSALTVLAASLMTCLTLATGAQETSGRNTGIFLILDQAAAPTSLRHPTPEEYVALYDYKFLHTEARPEPKYYLLRKEPDVRLSLAGPPKRVRGEDGRTILGIDLAEDSAVEMERFTRDYLGRSAAFVVDGEVITAHKIRSVIANGEFYVSRCTDNACEYILARLTAR